MTRGENGTEPGPFDLTEEIGTSIAAKGNAVDRMLPRDPLAAEPIAREEYGLLLEAERQQKRRLHKGHPLHNLGFILAHAGRVEEARTYFHAAHVEDARSVETGATGWDWLARQVLLELYGERLSLIENLGDLARSSSSEPLSLARQFEADNRPFESYRGIRPGWRDDASLNLFQPEQLIFCAGSHGLPHHLKAMADGVRAAGLEPVVVMEFRNPPEYDTANRADRARMDYQKSERLLARCGLVVMDMSDPKGQSIELEMATKAKQPIWIGFSSTDPLDDMHGSSMYLGAAAVAGATRRAFRNTDELRDEVRDWCERSEVTLPGSPRTSHARTRSMPQLGLQGSNMKVVSGSAMPSALRGPADFEPPEIVPSGSYMPPTPDPIPTDVFENMPRENDDY